MKKLYTIFMLTAIVALGFTACQKDDDKGSIVGKWEAQTYSYKTWINNVLENSEDGTHAAGEFVVEFKADKTYTAVGEGETETGTYSVTGNKIKIKPNGDVEEESEFSITNNNNTLTIKQTGEEVDGGKTYRYELTEVLKRK